MLISSASLPKLFNERKPDRKDQEDSSIIKIRNTQLEETRLPSQKSLFSNHILCKTEISDDPSATPNEVLLIYSPNKNTAEVKKQSLLIPKNKSDCKDQSMPLHNNSSAATLANQDTADESKNYTNNNKKSQSVHFISPFVQHGNNRK